MINCCEGTNTGGGTSLYRAGYETQGLLSTLDLALLG
jgi:hypothetical protein